MGRVRLLSGHIQILGSSYDIVCVIIMDYKILYGLIEKIGQGIRRVWQQLQARNASCITAICEWQVRADVPAKSKSESME